MGTDGGSRGRHADETEKGQIEPAMVNFANHVRSGNRDKSKTEQLCLEIARAIRSSIAPAFDLEPSKSDNLRSK
jgi:hypothetical protein